MYLFNFVEDMLGKSFPSIDEPFLGNILDLEIEYFPSVLISNLKSILHNIVGILIVKHLN